jgi:hypothetical protein
VGHDIVVSSLDANKGYAPYPDTLSTFSTASVSADAGDLLIFWIASTSGGGNSSSISGISGLTWEKQAARSSDPGGQSLLECWTAAVPSGGVSGSLTVEFAVGTSQYNYDLDVAEHVCYLVPVVAGNVQTASENGNPSSLTFDTAADVENLFLFGCMIESNSGQTPEESPAWSVVADVYQVGSYTLGLETQLSPDATDTTASSSWSTNPGDRWAGIGLELAAC